MRTSTSAGNKAHKRALKIVADALKLGVRVKIRNAAGKIVFKRGK